MKPRRRFVTALRRPAPVVPPHFVKLFTPKATPANPVFDMSTAEVEQRLLAYMQGATSGVMRGDLMALASNAPQRPSPDTASTLQRLADIQRDYWRADEPPPISINPTGRRRRSSPDFYMVDLEAGAMLDTPPVPPEVTAGILDTLRRMSDEGMRIEMPPVFNHVPRHDDVADSMQFAIASLRASGMRTLTECAAAFTCTTEPDRVPP